MLTKVEVIPVSGSSVTLNTTDGSGNHLYPLGLFEINTAIDSRDAKKWSAAGQWATWAYPDAMTIHAEGMILGIGASDAARSTSYITQRLALLDAVLPPVALQTSRKHATLRVRFDGMSEDADADVICIQQSIPLRALVAAASEFMITWKGFLPYFTGVSTSTKYQLG